MSFSEHFKRMFGFNITAIIMQRRGNTIKLHIDKAKKIDGKDGKVSYSFKILRKDFKPPDTDCIYVDTRGREYLFLSTTDMSQFIPTKVSWTTSDGAELIPIDKDMINWLVTTYQKGVEKYSKPTFFQQYGGLLTIFGLVIGYAIMMQVNIQYLESVAQQIGGLSSALISATENFKTMCIQSAI